MRIVLDACVPAGLARFFPDHDVTTVSKLFGTSDLDDRVLLKQLDSRCDAFVTVDKGIAFQQNLRHRPFPVLLLRAHSNTSYRLCPARWPRSGMRSLATFSSWAFSRVRAAQPRYVRYLWPDPTPRRGRARKGGNY